MTIFHVIGYWYLALTLTGIAAFLTYALIEFLGRSVWKKMTRLRDVYVLNWWIHAINSTGRTVPTKGNVDLLFEKLEEQENRS